MIGWVVRRPATGRAGMWMVRKQGEAPRYVHEAPCRSPAVQVVVYTGSGADAWGPNLSAKLSPEGYEATVVRGGALEIRTSRGRRLARRYRAEEWLELAVAPPLG